MKKLVMILAVLALVPSSAMASKAAAGGSADGDVEPDKGDGCGLGWQVTRKRSMIATTTRGTTNGVVPPTFGMTTGTIGCEQHSFAKAEAPAVIFTETNYEQLSVEMASGSGEYLEGLARTMGCQDAVVGDFGRTMKANYRSIVGEKASGVQMYKNVKSQINAHPVLSLGCSA